MSAYSLAGSDLKDLRGKADGALDTQLLVLGTVDQVIGDCLGGKMRTPP